MSGRVASASAGVARATPRLEVAAGLWTIYLAWGSGYLSMRVMVRTVPPLLGSSARFVIAGGLLCAWVAYRRGRGGLRITRRQAVGLALTGVLLAGLGNGLNTVATQWLASGFVALIVASTPLWVVVLRALLRERVRAGTLLGVGLGFAGVALLLLPGGHPGHLRVLGVVLSLVASLCWATGSILTPRLGLPSDPIQSVAYQMLFGALALIVVGIATGELGDLHPSRFSAESLGGLAWLVVVCSLVGYSAWSWLIRNASVSAVTTYAFVNPVIAVFLGWLILDERVTWLTVAAAAVIVAAVATIVGQEARWRRVSSRAGPS